MAFSAHARGKNFTLEHLKSFLNAYKQVPNRSTWGTANTVIEALIANYVRTHSQVASQMGIEYKPRGAGEVFTVHKYLYCLDNEMLSKYLEFWSMLYFAPNPRVTHGAADTPINIFVKLSEEILASATNTVHFPTFFSTHIGGSNEDITRNSLSRHSKYIYLDGDEFKVTTADAAQLQDLVDYINNTFPVPADIDDKRTFFDRFSKDNFRDFFAFLGETLIFPLENIKHNKIFYGAPGTGKSYKLKKGADCYFDSNKIERINFYNGYTYGQFVGTYKPAPIYRDWGIPGTALPAPAQVPTFNYKEFGHYTRTLASEPYVVYEYVPGFFLKILIEALNDSNKNYGLIIEEINRAKVDSVFGDMFQLLDRNGVGKSEYRVKCPDEMLAFIETTGLDPAVLTDITDNGLYIPENLYIWATMNSADQGVFPMDTAFKRRWDFDYIGLNDNEGEMTGYEIDPNDGTIVNKEWNNFRRKINQVLSNKFNISEDKLLAPFFVKKNDFNSNNILKSSVFINKVIMYLKEDVLRHRDEEEIFLHKQFSDIVDNYKRGDPIFKPSFIIELNT